MDGDKSGEIYFHRSFRQPDFLNDVYKEIDYIRERVSILNLGANIRDYIFFQENTPQIAVMADDSLREAHSDKTEYSKDKCTILFNFVYELVIKWEANVSRTVI